MKSAGPLFTKLHGTMNSFVFVDARTSTAKKSLKHWLGGKPLSAAARFVCSSSGGMGADGFVVLVKSFPRGVEWDFYNSDGSRAQMCGNAARCAGAYLKRRFQLLTGAGVVLVNPLGKNLFQVTMPQIVDHGAKSLRLKSGEVVTFQRVNTGVPHVVIERVGFSPQSLRDLALEIQNHDDFKPEGTNVTFYEPRGPSKVRTATFERGVRNFTMACGTGAVAAAFVFAKGSAKPVSVTVPGGQLKVKIRSGQLQILEGPAVRVSDFQFNQKLPLLLKGFVDGFSKTN